MRTITLKAKVLYHQYDVFRVKCSCR